MVQFPFGANSSANGCERCVLSLVHTIQFVSYDSSALLC